MSLPSTVHATLVRTAVREGQLYVASLAEMTGINVSGESPEEALEALRSAVEEIQRSVDGEAVEVVEPPIIGYRWIQFYGGALTRELTYNFELLPGGADIAQEELALANS